MRRVSWRCGRRACPATIREPAALSALSGRLAHKTQTFPRIVPCMLRGPLTLLEGVPVSIFSWVAMRTDMVCVQVPLVSPPRCACTFVQRSSSCWRCPRPPPPSQTHTHTFLPLFSNSTSLHQLMAVTGWTTRGVRDPDQSHSLTPLQEGINPTFPEEVGKDGDKWG